MSQLDNSKDRSLAVLDNRKTPRTRNIPRRCDCFRAQFDSLFDLGISIIHGKVNHPVRWYIPHLRRRGIHATSRTLSVSKRSISHWPHLLDVLAPAKELRVEVTGSCSVLGGQFIPAKRIWYVNDSCAFGLARLPEREDSTSRVL